MSSKFIFTQGIKNCVITPNDISTFFGANPVPWIIHPIIRKGLFNLDFEYESSEPFTRMNRE